MIALRRKRTQLRREFTTQANEIEQLAGEQRYDDFHELYALLSDTADKLFEIENAVRDEWCAEEQFDEQAFQSDQDKVVDYRKRFKMIQGLYKKISPMKCQSETSLLSADTVKSNADSAGGNKNRRFQLPKLELMKFDGNVKNWLLWWGQFRKIHEGDLEDLDKFQYLLQSMTPESNARQLIESYPPSGENYQKALDALKARFAREDILIETYVRGILNLVLLQNKGENHPINNLYDNLHSHLQALETLGVANDKYASILYPMIESALPEDVLRTWNRIRYNNENKGDDLTKLMKFLKDEVESEERILMAKSGFPQSSSRTPTACFVTESKTGKDNDKSRKGEAVRNTACIWCEKDTHASSECHKAAKMTLSERKDFLKNKRGCPICLKVGHSSKRCRSFPKCLVCKKRHVTLMCYELDKESVDKEQENKDDTKLGNMLCHIKTTTILQTLSVIIVNGTNQATVRVLLDSGAQRSYVSKDLVTKLQLKPFSKESITHCLFGGFQTKTKECNVYNVCVSSSTNNFRFNLNVLEQDSICGLLPKIKSECLVHKLRDNNITLTETVDTPDEVSILLGADYSGTLLTGDVIQVDNSLTAIKTKLGWTIQGPVTGVFNTVVNNHNVLALHSFCKFDLADLWSLEVLGIKDPAESVSKQARATETLEKFNSSLRINEESRYEVRLPWRDGMPLPVCNFEVARKRLVSTSSRLVSLGKLEDYDGVFKEWLNLDFIEPSPVQNVTSGFFLPHHAVIKESSQTTKIRPVFDASAKDINGVSLNSCLEKGENLIELIPELIISFRKYAIGITADIAKAFLQISVSPEDREYLKFLWWADINDHSKGVIIYRHRRVVFGVTSSPFHLAATIAHHLNNCPTDLKDTAMKLKKSFYVDNCVISLSTEEDMTKFIKEAKEVMKMGKFDLRCWVTGPARVDQAVETISVLGILWNTITDDLCSNVSFLSSINVKCTKRNLLSITHKFFDPIGLYSPITIIPKLILQKSWSRNLKWDDELPLDLCKEFQSWSKNLHLLQAIKIPRRLTRFDIESSNSSLHVFADASQYAYATCIFLRTEFKGEVDVSLVMAKSRVAPVKKITIPRLELIAVTMAVRLAKTVIESLGLPRCEIHYWTDSSVVLSWIKGEGDWNVFVANRVREIRSSTAPDAWRHVPGNLNPADIPSRGIDVKGLIECQWWKGPSWLAHNTEGWPGTTFTEDSMEVNKERKKSTLIANVCEDNDVLSKIALYFSSYAKTVRMVAWILRMRFKPSIRNTELLYHEVERAEQKLFKLIQTSQSPLKLCNLRTFVDEIGLLRIETKLGLSNEKYDFKHPIILPSDHVIVKRLVQERHKLLHHAGTLTLMTNLRERFWIIGVRKLVKRVIRECVVCRRYKAKSCTTPPASLPKGRVEGSVPFEVSGVDLTGPLVLRSGKKCWIVLFTCATYRAVHLEVVESLSTEDFIMALRRFIARRGRVKVIYSDNGTNFRGLSNQLKELDWSEVLCFSSLTKLSWNFIPPGSPWWGGFYERLIGFLKQILRRVLGKASVTLIELQTVLCDCESVINSRPLTYVSTDADELRPLTPASFIQPLAEASVPELDKINSESLNVRVRYMKKLRDDFKERFRAEYLGHLVQRSGRANGHFDLHVGDIVLIGSDDKRVNWPLGLVVELFEGPDNVSRVAKLRTATGFRVRPLQRLFPLEVSEGSPTNSSTTCPRTRSGRLIRCPVRLDL